MLAPPADISAPVPARPSAQRLVRLLSGPLLMFVAFGVGSWFSGLCSWIGFYLGARDGTLVAVAQCSAVAGFVAAVAGCLAWYHTRAARGRADLPPWTVPVAFLALPIGNIFWAIFVDATAWHYGRDIVRPAFDYAMMYLVLGVTLPMAVLVPWLLARIKRRATPLARSSST